MSGSSTPGRSRLIGLLTLVAAAALSVAALVGDSARGKTAPTPKALGAAIANVTDRFAPGEAVWVEPYWEDAAWRALEGLMPSRPGQGFPWLITDERPDLASLMQHDALWVIGTHNRRPLPPEAIRAFAVADSEPFHFGDGVTVQTYKLPQATAVRSLTGDLSKLLVSRIPKDKPARRCRFRGDAHRCKDKPWFDVRVRDADVDHRDVEWVFAHPGPGSTAVQVVWPDLPPKGIVVLRAGHNLAAVRKDVGEDVTLTVALDKLAPEVITLPAREYTTFTRVIHLADGADPKRKRALTLNVSSPDHEWRQVLLQAELYEALDPALIESLASRRP